MLQRRTFAKAVAVSTLFVVAVCLAATGRQVMEDGKAWMLGGGFLFPQKVG